MLTKCQRCNINNASKSCSRLCCAACCPGCPRHKHGSSSSSKRKEPPSASGRQAKREARPATESWRASVNSSDGDGDGSEAEAERGAAACVQDRKRRAESQRLQLPEWKPPARTLTVGELVQHHAACQEATRICCPVCHESTCLPSISVVSSTVI